jgi:ribosome maturation factor RimP
LEVGTRGVEAPLTRPAHWRRNRGRLVAITRADGQSLTARILDADDDRVELADDLSLPYAEITRAQVQVEMNRDEEEEE